MATTKEILQMVLERIEDLPQLESGICREIRVLALTDFITEVEATEATIYVMFNKPYRFYLNGMLSRYGWPQGEVAPRVAWLKEQIEKL